MNAARHPAAAAQPRLARTLACESLEPRAMFALLNVLDGSLAPPAEVIGLPPEPLAVGSITYSATARTISIAGSNAHNDVVNVFINRRAGNGAGDLPDLLTVTLANINTPQSFAISPAAVDKIFFFGYGGNDFLDNRTSLPLQADGGAGNDVLLGGTGADNLLGGDGDDYLDGRVGNDRLSGQNGNDVLFGDEGTDWLYGGAGVDFLFGGNGNDALYGEAGNDKLYGGAGRDNLSGGAGTNTNYTDFGPDRAVSASGFSSFDWFDRYLKDPSVRAQARFLYRDGVITRGDMLQIYKTISTDGVESVLPFNGTVTANELADLKALVDAKVNFQVDTRYFAQRIAFGDPANATYQAQPLGNLAAGVRGSHLDKLVDKWFKGGDLPVIEDRTLRTLRYERVAGQLFVGGPSYTDIDQGSVGDCYLMAALGEVAQHAPSLIQNMFADNGDDTWTVRFFRGGSPVYVTVNRLLPAFGYGTGVPWAAGWGIDSMGFQRGTNDAANELWVALIEKAYAQLNASGGIGQDGTNSYLGIESGLISDAFHHITGRSASYTSLWYLISPPSASGLINAINSGYAVGLATKEDPASDLIVPSHAYMVTGYNATTRMFQLFNPHGFWNNNGPGGASQSPILEASWDAILANFAGYTKVLI